MSAPTANRNRTTHGCRGWLALGSLPKGAAYIRRITGELRRQLEQATIDTKGELTLYSSALIQSTCRHEGRALLLGRWLRVEADLPLSDRLALMKEIGNATDSRDKCLKLLGLDLPPASADPWREFDRLRLLPPATVPPAGDTSDAGHCASARARLASAEIESRRSP